MANKKKFTDEENSKIYFATYRIKSCLFMHAGGAIMKSSALKSEASSITAKLTSGSSIHNHIQQRNWEELFKDDDWLEFLELAQNVNTLFSPERSITNELITIAKHFPEETAGRIFVELLN
jgi:hypothetical protein